MTPFEEGTRSRNGLSAPSRDQKVSPDVADEGDLRTSAPDVLFVVRHLSSYPDIIDGLKRLARAGLVRGQECIEVRPEDALQRADEYWKQIVDHVRDRQSEIVVFHHFHNRRLPDPRPVLRQLKSLSHRPIVAVTNGDAFCNKFLRPSFPRMFLQAAEEADIVFSSSMGAIADHLAKRSRSKVALMPHGACQARFGQVPSIARDVEPEFNAVFIGSNNRPRNPSRPYHWYARRRERLINLLTARFGSKFAVFGRGWEGLPSWQGPLPFEQQQVACQRAELVVGGVPFSSARYYTSDRVFIHIASGVPFVDVAVEGVETILRDGEHWHLVQSIREVADRCDELLCRPRAERLDAGRAAAEFVLAHHTIEERCRSMITLLGHHREAVVVRGDPPPLPDFDFFLPEVDRSIESPRASRW
jgi:hypothetical protein